MGDLFLFCEIATLVIHSIMCMSGDYGKVISGYGKTSSDKPFGLWLMAICGGWILFPYFVYLVAKYRKIIRKERRDGE